jgi:hypothetical protein
MEKKLTPVEWFFRELENINGYSAFYTNNYQHVDALYNEAKQIEIEQTIDLLTKYHDNLFYIPLKVGEAEAIYNHLNTIEK